MTLRNAKEMECLMRNLTAIRALGVGRGMECPGILFPHGSPVAGAKRGGFTLFLVPKLIAKPGGAGDDFLAESSSVPRRI